MPPRYPRLVPPPIQGVSNFIGATPLLQLWNLGTRDDLEVYGKPELFNPASSTKDRTARPLLQDAVASGRIHEGSLVVEPGSGSLGIALARACCLEEVRFLYIVDAQTDRSVVIAMKAYGVQAEVTWEPDPDLDDLLTTWRHRVAQVLTKIPSAVNLNQYGDPANPRARREGTMTEIANALNGDVDELFVATDATGTISGCAGYCAEHGLSTRLTAVSAMGNVLFGDQPGRRLIPGFGAGVEPLLAEDLRLNGVIRVSDTQIVAGYWRLALLERLFLGGSSGAMAQTFLQRGPSLGPGSEVVLLFRDGGTSYLNTVYGDDWVRERLGVEPGRMRELAFAPGPAPSMRDSG